MGRNKVVGVFIAKGTINRNSVRALANGRRLNAFIEAGIFNTQQNLLIIRQYLFVRHSYSVSSST
jgi:hypothetical protein